MHPVYKEILTYAVDLRVKNKIEIIKDKTHVGYT